MKIMKRSILVLMIVLSLVACRKVALYHGLNEDEANEMLVVLQKEGIKADKIKEVRQNEVFWVVEVDPKKITDAQRIISEHNLPRKKEPGLIGVYKEKGLIPTPDEQKARYLLALKGEIINSLLKIPDVVDADVVLNIPSPDEFANTAAKEKRPTASVVIKARPTDLPQDVLTEQKIQQFVANAVENLNPRDVSVIITYVSAPKRGLMPGQSLILPPSADVQRPAVEDRPVTRIAGLEVVSSSQSRLKVYLAVFFIILAVLAVALIVTVIRTSRMRDSGGRDGGPERPMIDGKVVEDRPRLKEGR